MPFSEGRRKCVAEVMSKSVLISFIVLLFQSYDFKLPDSAELELKYEPFALANVPNSFKVIIRQREIVKN